MTAIGYRDMPEDGLLVGVTYGLSLNRQESWRLGRPELSISVRSDDPAWVLAIAYLAEQLRHDCPFSYGDTINSGEPVAAGSSLDGFVVFAPLVLDPNDARVDVGDDLPIVIVGMYPTYAIEREYIGENGWKPSGNSNGTLTTSLGLQRSNSFPDTPAHAASRTDLLMSGPVRGRSAKWGIPLNCHNRTRSKSSTSPSRRPYPLRVDVLRTFAAAAVAVAALASCDGEEATDYADDAGSSTGASSPSSTKSGTGSQSPSALAEPATLAKDLFAIIDAAIAKETSVRQEVGNLNPPPSVVLEQEYGDDRDQLALTMDLGPHTDRCRSTTWMGSSTSKAKTPSQRARSTPMRRP